MADSEHIRILKQGVEAFNKWRKENPKIRVNLILAKLRGADLSYANLRGANLRGADLSGADLSEANLSEANLSHAILRGSNLRGANLSYAYLMLAKLTEANLIEASLLLANLLGADLNRADLSRADLSNAILRHTSVGETDFSFAKINYTDFGNIDLSNVSGLESTEHRGPSTIGIDTIFQSGGKIPHKFLEDAGVPYIFIEYMGSLTGQSYQFYSCFISYSNNDKEFADRIHTDLRKEGVRCWFAPEDMKIGDKIRQTIDQSIRIYDKLLLVLSENSINSKWVEKEVETAFEKETRKKTVLFPVRLDDSVMETDESWAADIRRTRHIGDFTNWKDYDSYQQAFKRLIRDLQAEDH